MKRSAVFSAIVAASMFTGQFATAQGDGNPYDRNNQGQRNGQQDQRRHNARQPDRNRAPARGYGDELRDPQDRGYQHDQRDERGAGPDHAFRRGERLPTQYRSRQYVVEDWRGHRLSAPPRGYHWVQTGGDYVLVAIATGIILQLMLNN